MRPDFLRIILSQISVMAGELRIETDTAEGGGNRHLFAGTSDVANSVTLLQNAKDALRYEDTEINRAVPNLSGTFQLKMERIKSRYL